MKRALVAIAAFALAVPPAGCKKRESAAETEPVRTMPEVREGSADLLLTWVDDEGGFRVTGVVGEVPPSARDVVRVSSPAVADPDPNTVFVADLRNARPDGSFTVSTMGRAAFDRMAVERRKARAPEPEKPSAAEGEGAVIYGASWCGPCHQAEAWFKSVGVPFVEHDIEEEPSARDQMQAALERSGRRGGSIPVIVWHGRVFIGFDVEALEAERARR